MIYLKFHNKPFSLILCFQAQPLPEICNTPTLQLLGQTTWAANLKEHKNIINKTTKSIFLNNLISIHNNQ